MYKKGLTALKVCQSPLSCFSLITHHFSLITSLQRAYTARRSQRCQRGCQNRYNYLYHRLPCFLLHSLKFSNHKFYISNFNFQTQRVAPVGALFNHRRQARFPCHHLRAGDYRHCRRSHHPAMDCSTRCPQSHRCR